jgi:hypothetical protein
VTNPTLYWIGQKTRKEIHVRQEGFYLGLSTLWLLNQMCNREVNKCQLGFLSSLDALGWPLGQRFLALATSEEILKIPLAGPMPQSA